MEEIEEDENEIKRKKANVYSAIAEIYQTSLAQ